jgi:DivIVA domain-containing protein
MKNETLWRRLTVSRIRTAHFPVVRRGYDPQAVHRFLDWLADEVQRLHLHLAEARAERDQVKQRLRRRQREHVAYDRTQRPDRFRQVTSDRWPINGTRARRADPPTTTRDR